MIKEIKNLTLNYFSGDKNTVNNNIWKTMINTCKVKFMVAQLMCEHTLNKYTREYYK